MLVVEVDRHSNILAYIRVMAEIVAIMMMRCEYSAGLASLIAVQGEHRIILECISSPKLGNTDTIIPNH